MKGEVLERDAQDRPVMAVYCETPEEIAHAALLSESREKRGAEVKAALARAFPELYEHRTEG